MKEAQSGASGLKYIRLREWLMESIDNCVFRYGDKLPSENMLCKKFSISRQTVRNAIDQLEEEGIVRRVRGSGTFVDKEVAAKPRNCSVGVLLSYLDDYIFPQIMRGIEEVLTREGYGIDLGITHNRIESEARFLERMLSSNVAGIIVEGSRSALPNPNLDLFRQLAAAGVPVIFLHNSYQGLDSPKVVMDDCGCSRRMTEMLIAAGHRNIAGIFKSDDLQGHWRYKGYIEALRNAGVGICEEYIRWYNTEDFDNGTVFKGDEDFAGFIQPCTAVVCYNDQIAALACSALERNGKSMPEDISLVSFDDSVLAGVAGFTSATHPKSFMGSEVAERLIRMMAGAQGPLSRFNMVIPVHIEKRPSIKEIQI